MFISDENEIEKRINKNTKKHLFLLFIRIFVILFILFLIYLYLNRNNYKYTSEKNAIITVDLGLLIKEDSLISNNLLIINNHQSTCDQNNCSFKSNGDLFLAFYENDIYLVDSPYQFNKEHFLCKNNITCNYEFDKANIKITRINNNASDSVSQKDNDE